jgi:hypothetical protein
MDVRYFALTDPRTHPPDPSNTAQFRRNGGGVMIAVRADLHLSSKVIQLKEGQEFLLLRLQHLRA